MTLNLRLSFKAINKMAQRIEIRFGGTLSQAVGMLLKTFDFSCKQAIYKSLSNDTLISFYELWLYFLWKVILKEFVSLCLRPQYGSFYPFSGASLNVLCEKFFASSISFSSAKASHLSYMSTSAKEKHFHISIYIHTYTFHAYTCLSRYPAVRVWNWLKNLTKNITFPITLRVNIKYTISSCEEKCHQNIT